MHYYASWKTTGYYRKDSLKLAARCTVSGCWHSCFRLSIRCLSCEDTGHKVERWCPDGNFLRVFSASRFTGRIPFLSPNQQCRSPEEETTGWKYNGLPYSIGWPDILILQCSASLKKNSLGDEIANVNFYKVRREGPKGTKFTEITQN